MKDRMKPSILLRIASIITLLYFAGHTAGMPWTPAVGPGELPIIEAMKTHAFEAGGVTRTYWDFYFGFGVCISAFLLLQAVVLWQLGSLAKRDAVQARPFVASFSLHSLSMPFSPGNFSSASRQRWQLPLPYVWGWRSIQRDAAKAVNQRHRLSAILKEHLSGRSILGSPLFHRLRGRVCRHRWHSGLEGSRTCVFGNAGAGMGNSRSRGLHYFSLLPGTQRRALRDLQRHA